MKRYYTPFGIFIHVETIKRKLTTFLFDTLFAWFLISFITYIICLLTYHKDSSDENFKFLGYSFLALILIVIINWLSNKFIVRL